jgi:hypothetical protein
MSFRARAERGVINRAHHGVPNWIAA